jgi:Ras GTPase-activating protein 2
MPIQVVDEDSEVEGRIHFSIKFDHVISSRTGETSEKLAVRSVFADSRPAHTLMLMNSFFLLILFVSLIIFRVIECSELSLVNDGCCHPFVRVSLSPPDDISSCSSSPNRNEVKRTKTRKKTTCPLFHETFHFDVSLLPFCPLFTVTSKNNCLFFWVVKTSKVGSCGNLSRSSLKGWQVKFSVFHDSIGVSKFGNYFLGEVVIPLDKIDLENGYKCWHMLHGRRRKLDDRITNPSLGSLRLRVQYTSDYVLSTRYYQPLKTLLLKSPDMKVSLFLSF